MVLPTLLASGLDVRIDESDLRKLSRTAEQVLAEARSADLDIKPIGVALLDRSPRAYAGDKTDWALMPVDADPTARDGLPIPRGPRRQLERIVKAGIEMDELLIAHEVPKGSLPLGKALTPEQLAKVVAVPEPAKVAAASAMIGDAIERTVRGVGRGARTTAKGAGIAVAGAAVAAAAVAIAPLALLQGLDPVIIGGRGLRRRPSPGDPFVWFELARWEW